MALQLSNFLELIYFYMALTLTQVIIVSSASETFRNIEPQLQKEIDDFILNVYLPSSKISTLGLGIVKNNGEILYSTGFGLANKDQNISNGNKTQFLIGSATKSITATLVIKLLSEKFPELGAAVLDTPVRELIPSADLIFSDRFRTEHTTFRDLLSHRMCFFRDDLQILAEAFSTTEEMAYRQRYAESICEFRSEFQYNSQMFVIAGELIEILTNRSYTDLMKGFLNEIGMVNSDFINKFDNSSAMTNRALPYYFMNGLSHSVNPELIKRLAIYKSAGSLYITPDDMILFMKVHLNKGNVNGKQLIRQDVMEWITKPAMTIPISTLFKTSEEQTVVTTFGYGLGMMLAAYNGWEFNYHPGYFPPYRTLISFLPGHNLGIFTSSNEGPAWVDPTALHICICEILRGNTKHIANSRNLLMNMRKEKERMNEKMLNEFLEKVRKNIDWGNYVHNPWEIIGQYGSGASGDAEILPKYNPERNLIGLYLRYGKWYRGWLENFEGSIYSIKFDTDVLQDYYASGITQNLCYAIVSNKTLQIANLIYGEFYTFGTFKLGVNLDTLPNIPWSPNSC